MPVIGRCFTLKYTPACDVFFNTNNNYYLCGRGMAMGVHY